MGPSLKEVPIGVWIGVVIILAGAWVRDGWGIALGVIVVVVTTITTSNAQDRVEEETAGEGLTDDELDDGWPFNYDSDESGTSQP